MNPILYSCKPDDWVWLPKPIRIILGWVSLCLFTLTFLSIPISIVLILTAYLEITPIISAVWFTLVFISMLSPAKEWPFARKIAQLWYEIFDFSCNLSPEQRYQRMIAGRNNQFIIAMHPHGIIPLQAILWTSYCEQYLTFDNEKLYGFGAAADAVAYIPFLRNVMHWLTAGSAEYKVLKDGLSKGISPSANAVGRKPKHLFILPGGIAEIFTSTPGRDAIVFKNRRGLIRLSIETGAQLLPTYVFGGTDFFHNLATHDNYLSALSRKFKIGITWFWGQFWLPIPYTPKVSLCIGDPLPVKKWENEDPIPEELIDELHQKYISAMLSLFEKYKSVAGYPGAKLEIL